MSRADFDPTLYLVTDTALCGERGVVETVRQAIRGGVTAVQVRAKDASAAEALVLLMAVAEAAAEASAHPGGAGAAADQHRAAAGDQPDVAAAQASGDAAGPRVQVLMNDRVDVYLAARALGATVHGVHVGQDDLPASAVRELVGPAVVVGLTANTPAHFAAALSLPPGTVDYLGVGVIRPTSTKADHPHALGVDGFAALAASTSLPCVAIGGITHGDAAAIRECGGAGLAVVSQICAADDPEQAAVRFRQEWSRGAASADHADVTPATSAAAPTEAAPRRERRAIPAATQTRETPATPITPAAPLRGTSVIPAAPSRKTPAAPSRRTPAALRSVPRVLSIAGTDPTGGAGIHADLKSIAANGGYGMAVVTSLVAQNTRGVRSVHTPPPGFLREQLDAVSDDVVIDAVKIGMLGSTATIGTVRDWLVAAAPPIVVLDPVMISTSGDRLLDAAAEGALRELLSLADVVTPNLSELAALLGERPAESWAAALEQAARLSQQVGTTVLAKGGHLAGEQCPDALVDASGALGLVDGLFEVQGARVHTRNTHGTGCSLSSALATQQARLGSWPESLVAAKHWLLDSLRTADDLEVGHGNGPINHFHALWAAHEAPML